MRALESIIHVGIKHHRWGENYSFSPVLHIFSEPFGTLISLDYSFLDTFPYLYFSRDYWCDSTVFVCFHLAYIFILHLTVVNPVKLRHNYITVLVFAHYYVFGVIIWIRGCSSLDADIVSGNLV